MIRTVEEENSVNRFLKLAGILALIALPVYLAFKKRKPKDEDGEDDSNIFAAELEE
jgi:hypothetical protein